MHKHPCPDHPKASKVRVLAVERLVRRPVVQGCMISLVGQVTAVCISSPQRRLSSVESASMQRTMFMVVLPARSFTPICWGVFSDANCSWMPMSRQYYR